MYKRNDGINDQDILQNQFTAYISTAIHRERLKYLKEKCNRLKVEIEFEEYHLNILDDSDLITESLESECLLQALRIIKKKERDIFLARALDEKSFSQIADEFGMKYKSVAAMYYRTVTKLRKILRGDNE